jgi:hypothetical protein
VNRLIASCLVAVALILSASVAGSEPVIRIGANFDLGYPQEEFRDNVDNTGLGGGMFLTIGFPDLPVQIGVSADVMEYGRESREAPWSTTIPDIFVDVETTNDIVAAHLFLRLQPSSGFFQPYAEGLIGFHYLSTSTSVSDQDEESETIASTKHLSDFVFSYGAGAGVMFEVWKRSETPDSGEDPAWKDDLDEEILGEAAGKGEGKLKVRSVGVFVDARYLKGNEAEYLREGSITVEDGRVEYDVRRSRTDLVVFRIGFSVNFL